LPFCAIETYLVVPKHPNQTFRVNCDLNGHGMAQQRSRLRREERGCAASGAGLPVYRYGYSGWR
jgi:hypothetical protein